MLEDTRSKQWLKFILSVIFPTSLAIFISIASIYIVIIPSFEDSLLESKREMILELTKVAWSILVIYEKEEHDGTLTREEAQKKAIEEIEHLRYGDEFMDYFWISDMQPRLIMHPYSKELIGSDLSQFEDSAGKRVFMEIKKAVSDGNSGFIDYNWNKKYTTLKDVPKLSYVKKFEPWDWVVGTGVFIDDVQVKIQKITRRLTWMIYGTVVLFSLLLLIVTLHSLRIERKRRNAERDLRQSRKKYKTLAETAVDPIMMIHNGSCIYANKSMEGLLGYTAQELETVDLTDLFAQNQTVETGLRVISDALNGSIALGSHEALLRSHDGRDVNVALTLAQKDLGSQKVIVMTAQDVSGTKRIEEELGESREKYRLLTNRLHIGVFRTTPENRFRFLEANPVTLKLLGIADDTELLVLDLLDFIEKDNKDRSLLEVLESDGFAKEKIFRLKQRSGDIRTVSISMVMTKNSQGQPLHCDGIIEDISKQQKTIEERENLIVELQTSLMFLSQSVKNSLTDFVVCDLNTPIRTAARIMTESRKSSILVCSESGTMLGIITDVVLRELVVAEDISGDVPVHEIMSSPLIYIEDSALIFEAVLLLQERGIKHLVVKDSNDAVVSVISNEELLDVQRYSAAFLIEEIRNADSVEEIVKSHKRMPRIVKALTDSGAHAKNITRIITTISDTILGKLIDFAIEEIGEPPARFAFISLGSEGRGEQTLVTDQDNAIIFEDVVEERSEAVHDYFLRFSTLVCTWLDEAGYDFCKGNVMAMNPEWCQPVSTWKRYFSRWITESSPEDLMEVSIFFDFRCLYGDSRFTDQLREHIKSRAENKAAFLYNLAQNTLLFKIPIDFFGNISVESDGEHRDTFNIKHVISQIVSFARIYAVNYSLESINTLQRIDILLEKKVLNKATHEEIVVAYNFLMQMRFRHQVRRIDKGEEPDNFVNIKELTHMEKDMLVKILGQVNGLRKRLSLVGHNEIFF